MTGHWGPWGMLKLTHGMLVAPKQLGYYPYLPTTHTHVLTYECGEYIVSRSSGYYRPGHAPR
jgi:hypothetical protein